MSVRIFPKLANPMQRGRRNADVWLLEHEVPYACRADPLTGWQGSGDPRGAVTLTFKTRAAAVEFAERHGFDYHLFAPGSCRRQPVRPYAGNFGGSTVAVPESGVDVPPSARDAKHAQPMQEQGDTDAAARSNGLSAILRRLARR